MSFKTVVIGFLGTQLDGGGGAGRWEKWRPTVSLVQHEDMQVHRLELLHSPAHRRLAEQIQADITTASPDTEVNLVPLEMADPWDFGEVYQAAEIPHAETAPISATTLFWSMGSVAVAQSAIQGAVLPV